MKRRNSKLRVLMSIGVFLSMQHLGAVECVVDTDGDGVGDGTAGANSGGAQYNDFSLACGANAVASPINATAIGTNSQALGDFSLAIGEAADAGGEEAVAIGPNSKAHGTWSVSIGKGSQALWGSGVAVGAHSGAPDKHGVALGSVAKARAHSSVALGYSAEAQQHADIAIGAFANAGGFRSIAMGDSASAENLYSVAIGHKAVSTANGAIAMGFNSVNDIPYTMKVGVPLRVETGNGKGALKVIEKSGTRAQRFQIELENKGGTGFLLTNTGLPAQSQWQFATQPNEAFTASFIDTGGPEFQIRKDGAVQFGPGNVVNFNLTANGHMTLLHGSATATTFITSSSRDVKKDFKKVNPEGILQKIKDLEITQWRYKNENEKGLHIGPMAEDFYKLFELGADNKHVLGTDMASIAIVAAKELHEKANIANAETIQLKEETAKLKANNTSLKKQLVEQQKRLASLEKLVTNLALSNGHLNSSGAKVALK